MHFKHILFTSKKYICSPTGFIHLTHKPATTSRKPMNAHYLYHQNQSQNTSGAVLKVKSKFFLLFRRTSSKQPWISKLKANWIRSIWTENVHAHFQPSPQCLMKTKGFFLIKVSPWVAQRTTKKVAFSSLTGFKSPIKPNLSAWHGGVLARKPQTDSWQLPRVGSGRWKGNVAENDGR